MTGPSDVPDPGASEAPRSELSPSSRSKARKGSEQDRRSGPGLYRDRSVPPTPKPPGAQGPEPRGAKGEGSSSPEAWETVKNLPRRAAALALLGILLGILMGALDNLVVLTALPYIVVDLGQSSGVAFVVSAYLIAGTVATPIFGKLSDHYSRRNFFILGQAVFIAGSVLAGQAQSLNELIVFRAIQGFGSGAFFPVGLSMIAVLFDPQTRARLTGAMSSIFGIATIVGPLVGAYIVDQHTILGAAAWRWVFYVNIPIGLVSIVVVLTSVDALRPRLVKRFDTVGSLLLAGWVAPFMFALVQTSENGWAWTDLRVLALLGAFVALLVAFILWELRTPEPVVPLRFFAARIVAASSGVTFLRGVIFIGVSTFVSLLVASVYGGPSGAISDQVRDTLYFFVVPMILGATLGGQLLTRLPYRAIALPGMVLMAFGTFLLLRIDIATSLWPVKGAFDLSNALTFDLVPVGLGVGLTFAVTALSVQFAVPPKDVGAATSLVTFLQNLGGAVGVSLLFSYYQFRFIAPAPPSGLACPVPPPSDPTQINPACFPFYHAIQVATANAFAQTFQVTFVLSIAAVVFAAFMAGRLPRGRKMGGGAMAGG